MKKFALIGLAGYIAPRHLQAIKDTDNMLVAALDPSDSVGVIDSYFPDADFFTEFERFDRHIEKLRHGPNKIDYLTICSPNYLHDAHVRFGLRVGADVICEKPLVLNPWNVNALAKMATQCNRKINVILQLRLHPAIRKLYEKVQQSPKDKVFDVDLAYVAPRGKWYLYSWKGDTTKSGGIVTNIGIHFFDALSWIFGPVKKNTVHVYHERRAGGLLELQRANVRWALSLDRQDLPSSQSDLRSFRSIKIDGEEIEFSSGFTDLHTESYTQIFAGKGFGPDDAKASIDIVKHIRTLEPVGLKGDYHPLLAGGNK